MYIGPICHKTVCRYEYQSSNTSVLNKLKYREYISKIDLLNMMYKLILKVRN